MKIAIVAVGYNREDSLKNLLNSINQADYQGDKDVTLIVSLDKSDCQESIVKMANAFEWDHGEKTVRVFSERQGLRQHILQCGDLTSAYDAVVVLEDDLLVSKGFYSYVKQTVTRYSDDSDICGISLYRHWINPGCYRPFEAVQTGHDVFYMQFAQSWGQCWTTRMWTEFRKWYDTHSGPLHAEGIIPQYVADWNDKSWLKYYIKYTAEANKYFVYPYVSLTTNNAEAGEHAVVTSNKYQVPRLECAIEYRYPSSTEQAIKYDSFFERIFPEGPIAGMKGKIGIDLYGLRENKNVGVYDYLISTQERPYKVVKQIDLKFRPHEVNLYSGESGKGIYVYDVHDMKHDDGARYDKNVLIQYDLKAVDWRDMLKYSGVCFWRAFKAKIQRMIKR